MTREEHIFNLECIGYDGWTVTTEAYESLQWAIKELKQEPTDDATLRDIFCMGCEYKEQESDIDKYLKQIDHLHRYISKLETQIIMQKPCGDANANQHNSNALNDVGQRTNVLEDYAISIQSVLKQLKGCLTGGETEYKYVKLHIDSIPPVTPQQKTGEWIAQDIHNCHTNFKCSACGYIHNFMHLYGKSTADYPYCPNCGCRMIEPQESEEV